MDIFEDKDIVYNVLQKAFVSAYFTINDHKRRGQKIYTWMQHIVSRLIFEPLEAMNKWPTIVQMQDARDGLLSLLRGMDEKSQVAVHLTYNVGLSRRQAAMKLNIPVRQVEDLLDAALCKLQAFINNYHWK